MARALLLAGVLLASTLANALDNPDLPDLLQAFESEAEQHEQAIAASGPTDADMLRAYAAYHSYLDQELDRHYRGLLARLDTRAAQQLRASQQRWLRWRETEQRFVDNNWTPANFGSSGRITRAASHALLLRHRVIELIHYQQHYADTPAGNPP
jgi:uncharacterized protein YecT (DUF1311 family)